MHSVTESPAQRGLRPGNGHVRLDPAGSSDGADPAGSANSEEAPIGSDAEERGSGRHRSHGRPSRERRVNLRLSEGEYAALTEAAATAGLTPAGFATEAALAAARGEGMPEHRALRSLLLELMAARTQVRRYGVNVNQAVAQLQSTGDAPVWLERAAAGTDRSVARVEAAAAEVAAVLRRRNRQ
jgi:hypothetical protein